MNNPESIMLKVAPLSLPHLQIAQAQMIMSRYDFGALVRVTKGGFNNVGDSVTVSIEFQNEEGEFEGGPQGGFYVDFKPGTHEIVDVRAMIRGCQVGYMPGARLDEYEYQLNEAVNKLDDEGIALIQDWLDAREKSKGYLRGARVGHLLGLNDVYVAHPLIEADKAIDRAIVEQRGGLTVLIEGQRADRLQAALDEHRNSLNSGPEKRVRPVY